MDAGSHLFTCHDCCPARSTNGVSGIPRSESHTICRHLVDESWLLGRMSVRRQVTDTQVVGEHQNDVGFVEDITMTTSVIFQVSSFKFVCLFPEFQVQNHTI